jgi:insertion element IS1 protein InsB
VNIGYLNNHANRKRITAEIIPYCHVEECELDEMWSFVGSKRDQRWLWLAIDHNTRKIIAFAFGRRIQTVFKKLRKLLKPFDIRRYYSDAFACYCKLLPEKLHTVGKSNTQRIERKNLTLRTRIKRLARKTICFSKTIEMHDIVIGLVINILDFGLLFGNHFHAFCT